MKEVCFLRIVLTSALLAVSANHVRLQMKFGFGPTVMKIIAPIRKDGGVKSILDLLDFILYFIACVVYG